MLRPPSSIFDHEEQTGAGVRFTGHGGHLPQPSGSGARRGGAAPWLDAPAGRRWAIWAPVIALLPLVTYRLLEFVTQQWQASPWGEVLLHVMPPVAMLVVSLALWRAVPPLPSKGPRPPACHLGRSIAVGMLLGTMAATANLLLVLAGGTLNGSAGVATTAMAPAAAALVVHVVLLAPVAEEIAFRGLIYRLFRQNLTPVWATLLSALIFALMHAQMGKAIWAFFLGLIAAYAYEQTRSMLSPMLIHGLFNAVPIGVAVLRAKPDDPGPIWLVLAFAAVIFTLSARSASGVGEPDAAVSGAPGA